MLKKLIRNPLFWIISIASFLRLWGINHGYPFIFHPDEPTIIRSALGIKHNLNPDHFDWPHFYIYFNFILYGVFSKIKNTIPITWENPWIFYLLTRIATSVFGILTLIPIYLTGKTLFNKRVGLFSALALSFIPLHVSYSHYALTEVPMVFFLSCGLYFSTKILKDEKPSLKNYLLSGLFIGLSASTKYNGGLIAFIVPLATLFNLLILHNYKSIKLFLTSYFSTKHLCNWIYAGLAAILGFLLGTPYAILDYETFLRTDGPKGALWQFTNVGASPTFLIHITSFFRDILFSISKDMGYTLMFGFLFISVLLLLQKYKSVQKLKVPTKELYFLVVPAFLLLWYLSGFDKTRSHYYMIVYPFITVVFGYFVDLLFQLKNGSIRYLSIIFVFLIPLFLGFRTSYIFHNGDTRVDFYNWIKNTPEYSNRPVIYKLNILKEILGKAKVPVYKNGFDKIKSFHSGVLIITPEDGLPTEGYKMTLYKVFDNNLKKGPVISVYNYTK